MRILANLQFYNYFLISYNTARIFNLKRFHLNTETLSLSQLLPAILISTKSAQKIFSKENLSPPRFLQTSFIFSSPFLHSHNFSETEYTKGLKGLKIWL